MPPRVLVIGSGLAGLTTAYLLHREGCEVFLVERSDQLGFHSSSIVIPRDNAKVPWGQEDWVVDVPMRSFQGGYYPLLIALYRHLGLSFTSADFTFSFSRLHAPSPLRSASHSNRPTISTYFIHSGSSGLSLPSFPHKAYSSFIALLRHSVRWTIFAVCYICLLVLSFISWHTLLPLPRTLSALLDSISDLPILYRIIGEFIHEIFVPIFSAVGTMTCSDVLNTPLDTILAYVHNTFGTSHYALAQHSARDVARLLVEPLRIQGGEDHIRLGAEISAIRMTTKASRDDRPSPTGDQAFKVSLKEGDEIIVDRIVIATQASAAISLIDMIKGMDSHEDQRRVDLFKSALYRVSYRETIVVTHRDYSVLPRDADTRDINLVLPDSSLLHPTTESSYGPTPALSSTWTSRSPSNYASGPSTPMEPAFHQMSMPYFRPKNDEVYTMATHIIYPPSGFESNGPILQTTNPIVPIASGSVLGIARLERALPLENPDTILESLSVAPGSSDEASHKIHFVGSYAHSGIPLLEGCVGSALRVVKEILESEGLRTRTNKTPLGHVDWTQGLGGRVGRLWRWRARKLY
ncbi:hypothetical protein BD324DRAFT_648038 [Kockovaella imperatae]|uniref:Amine oxidase domain-containing protein n=1 Tax=Kockovaella imperatae TaxID=4999 RepID=A0A1Y1UT05_9TREE|nr:hypothetical protein BD324DRAFT_648038 [Kockovaella imperatae]ORX41148.1 hypothetical protein BD324DRAFT_648038 [Kockovaella imperatae]